MIPRGQPNPAGGAGASPKRVQVRYFAQLREQAGCAEEQVRTAAETPAGLYEELRDRHRFTLPAGRLQVAVNDDFAPWDTPLADGVSVAFIPPFAGG
ncbi:MAG: MoaD/ThiS family protein [Opitutaceae bacterium]|nr:MoaD/ThiS family protein [Opitutaceae bacterium]